MTKVLSNAQTAASVSPVGAATIKNPEQVTSFKADTCSLPHASRYELIKICFSVGGAGFTRTCRHVARPDSHSLAIVWRGRIHTHLPSCGEAGFILTCHRAAMPDSYSLAVLLRRRDVLVETRRAADVQTVERPAVIRVVAAERT